MAVLRAPSGHRGPGYSICAPLPLSSCDQTIAQELAGQKMLIASTNTSDVSFT